MRILVTGAAGFTGRVLVARLSEAGHQVVAAVRAPVSAVRGAATIVCGDLADASTLANVAPVDAVCHVAASVVLGGTVEEQMACFRANITSTTVLVRWCEANGVGRLVCSSSSSVYARVEGGAAVDENAPIDPQSLYAQSKLAADWLASSRLLRNVRSVILRYSSIYGSGQRGGSVLPLFVNAVLDGRRPAVHGSGLRSQDFVHVADVCEANLLSLEADVAHGEVFNVGSGEETTMLSLAEAVVERFGGSGVDFVPVEREDLTRFRFDISKARRLLGYSPRSLREGLRTWSAC